MDIPKLSNNNKSLLAGKNNSLSINKTLKGLRSLFNKTLETSYPSSAKSLHLRPYSVPILLKSLKELFKTHMS